MVLVEVVVLVVLVRLGFTLLALQEIQLIHPLQLTNN
jgi:hypothetical protein